MGIKTAEFPRSMSHGTVENPAASTAIYSTLEKSSRLSSGRVRQHSLRGDQVLLRRDFKFHSERALQRASAFEKAVDAKSTSESGPDNKIFLAKDVVKKFKKMLSFSTRQENQNIWQESLRSCGKEKTLVGC